VSYNITYNEDGLGGTEYVMIPTSYQSLNDIFPEGTIPDVYKNNLFVVYGGQYSEFKGTFCFFGTCTYRGFQDILDTVFQGWYIYIQGANLPAFSMQFSLSTVGRTHTINSERTAGTKYEMAITPYTTLNDIFPEGSIDEVYKSSLFVIYGGQYSEFKGTFCFFGTCTYRGFQDTLDVEFQGWYIYTTVAGPEINITTYI
jgi:hypothetical protein